MELRFFDDPLAFLDVAADHLAEQPVVSTVVSGVAHKIAADAEAGVPWPAGVPCWFTVVHDREKVVGAAMRTAKFGTHPAFLLPMSDEAATLLARNLVERDEPMTAANGALPAVQVFCEEMAAHVGGEVRVGQHTRLFELGELVEPPPVEGRLRPAVVDEEPLITAWFDAFMVDADEQAGRDTGGHPARDSGTATTCGGRIEGGRVFVWEDGSGQAVNVTAATQPAYGVSRIGPVYTPTRAPGPRLCQRRGRTDLEAAARQRRAALPVHRPGQPDVQQDLRGDRLPARGRHGESPRGVTPQ